MTCRERLEMYLRAHHAPFAEQHHPTAYTAQAAARSERLPPQMEAKMVVVVADGVETTLVLPASHRLDVERTAMVLRANRLRLAEESEFAGRFPTGRLARSRRSGAFTASATSGSRAPWTTTCARLRRHGARGGRHHRLPGRHLRRHDEPRVRGLRALGAPDCGDLCLPELTGGMRGRIRIAIAGAVVGEHSRPVAGAAPPGSRGCSAQSAPAAPLHIYSRARRSVTRTRTPFAAPGVGRRAAVPITASPRLSGRSAQPGRRLGRGRRPRWEGWDRAERARA